MRLWYQDHIRLTGTKIQKLCGLYNQCSSSRKCFSLSFNLSQILSQSNCSDWWFKLKLMTKRIFEKSGQVFTTLPKAWKVVYSLASNFFVTIFVPTWNEIQCSSFGFWQGMCWVSLSYRLPSPESKVIITGKYNLHLWIITGKYNLHLWILGKPFTWTMNRIYRDFYQSKAEVAYNNTSKLDC